MIRNIRGSLQARVAAGSLFSLLFLSSCASPSGVSASINNLAARGEYARAELFLEKNKKNYGEKNKLLYFLDQGTLLHLAKNYQKSSSAFEQAKKEYEQLHTRSITGIIGSWLFNEYTAPYGGEDFERVLINVFEALNYAMSNDLESALVEARDVDEKLRLINSRYGTHAQNVYKEDAFARFLMGIFYEARLDAQGYNNAFISYAKAAEVYESDYDRLYQTKTPLVLKENLLAAAEFMGADVLKDLQTRYGDIPFSSLTEKAKKAEVYLIHYNGPPPTKTEIVVPIPLPDANIVTLALAKYDRHYPKIRCSALMAKNSQQKVFRSMTGPVEDINAIAIKNLENKRARIIAKGVVTSAGKYVLEKALQQQINEKFGRTAEVNAILLSSVFNIYTNRADLRSWQTLPSEIRLGRLLLDPGEHDLSVRYFDFQDHAVGQADLGRVFLSPGDKRFFIIKTSDH